MLLANETGDDAHLLSENPKTPKNYAKSTLSVPHKGNNEAWMTTNMFTTLFTEYFKPNLTVKTYCSERVLSKHYCSLTVHLVTQEL